MQRFAAAAMRTPAGLVGAELRGAQQIGDLAAGDGRLLFAFLGRPLHVGGDDIDDVRGGIDDLELNAGNVFAQFLAVFLVHVIILVMSWERVSSFSRRAIAPEL
jgi:hypothetical protein